MTSRLKTGSCKRCSKPVEPKYRFCYTCMIESGHFVADDKYRNRQFDEKVSELERKLNGKGPNLWQRD